MNYRRNTISSQFDSLSRTDKYVVYLAAVLIGFGLIFSLIHIASYAVSTTQSNHLTTTTPTPTHRPSDTNNSIATRTSNTPTVVPSQHAHNDTLSCSAVYYDSIIDLYNKEIAVHEAAYQEDIDRVELEIEQLRSEGEYDEQSIAALHLAKYGEAIEEYNKSGRATTDTYNSYLTAAECPSSQLVTFNSKALNSNAETRYEAGF